MMLAFVLTASFLSSFTPFHFLLTCFDVSGGQLGVWSDPVHLTGWLATILASQTDADAEDDHGGSLPVQFPRVGRQV